MEELTKDAATSYMMGFGDVVAQVTCIHPELNLSQIGLGKVVVDGQLVDEEWSCRIPLLLPPFCNLMNNLQFLYIYIYICMFSFPNFD